MIGNKYNIRLVVEDIVTNRTQETVYVIILEIIPHDEGGFVAPVEEEENTDQIYEAHPFKPSIYGEMVIQFDYTMILPQGIEEWSSYVRTAQKNGTVENSGISGRRLESENEGTEYFEILYLPSKQSEFFFEETEIKEVMHWFIDRTNSRSITL